ncbi:MAG: Co2+/Mg2+ efflux protein ApaG [Flavipsychrobacter sp.]
MVRQVTAGVSVSVETFYQEEQSNPVQFEYLFAYRITIENQTSTPIQLKTRHWHIVESSGIRREVKGEGVVGEQPIIEPGAYYQYISAASLRADIGKMYGTYLMEDLYTKKEFSVDIPEFKLIPPFKMN